MKAFEIKNKKTLLDFFQKYLISDRKVDQESNPYYLMHDKMLLKRECGLKVNQSVLIELKDKGEGSSRYLTNFYTYAVNDYDSVAIQIELINFEVKVDKN